MNPYSQIPFLSCIILQEEYTKRLALAERQLIGARSAGLFDKAEQLRSDVDFFANHLRMVKEITFR